MIFLLTVFSLTTYIKVGLLIILIFKSLNAVANPRAKLASVGPTKAGITISVSLRPMSRLTKAQRPRPDGLRLILVACQLLRPT